MEFIIFYFWSIVFTARRHGSAVYAVVVCLSVCLSLSVCQVGVLLKRLNVGSRKQRHTIAQGLYSDAEDLGKNQAGSPSEAPNAGGVG